MPRLTISISDEQNEWLASEADDRDRSKAHVVRDILDAHRTGEVSTGEQFTTDDVAALADRVDELESRVATLEDDDSGAETPSPEPDDETSSPEPEGTETPTPERTRKLADAPTDVDLGADLGDVLNDWRPGRAPDEKREQRLAAGRAALHYLRERGAATAAEFRADVEPEYPVDGQSPDTWWKNTAREALKRAQEAGLVTFKDGVKEWRWTARADSDGDSGVYDPAEEF